MFDNSQIEAMVAAIVQSVRPAYIVLFGSHASGSAREDSDVDLLVVEREEFGASRSRWAELKRLRALLRPFKGAKDILVYGSEEARLLRQSANHIVGEAFRHGRIVYES